MDKRKEFYNTLMAEAGNEDASAYDYIANHYWEMSKDDLKDIILECLYAIHSDLTSAELYHRERAILREIAEELDSRWGITEEEQENSPAIDIDLPDDLEGGRA